MPSEVRRATPEDAPQIAEVIAEVLAEPEPVALEPMTPADVTAWLDRQGDAGATFVVDDGRQRVLAFAAIDADATSAEECAFGAWVRPRNRRQGHATALAEEALEFARERGYRRIRGRLPEGNEPALSFLSAIGGLVPFTNPGASFELPLAEEEPA